DDDVIAWPRHTLETRKQAALRARNNNDLLGAHRLAGRLLMVARHGLTFSRPIEYRSDAADLKPVMDMQKVIDMLQSHSLFEALE
ncbi:hypothetical protein C2W62_53690, partial [Candidatus Entotheonella serta]